MAMRKDFISQHFTAGGVDSARCCESPKLRDVKRPKLPNLLCRVSIVGDVLHQIGTNADTLLSQIRWIREKVQMVHA